MSEEKHQQKYYVGQMVIARDKGYKTWNKYRVKAIHWDSKGLLYGLVRADLSLQNQPGGYYKENEVFTRAQDAKDALARQHYYEQSEQFRKIDEVLSKK